MTTTEQTHLASAARAVASAQEAALMVMPLLRRDRVGDAEEAAANAAKLAASAIQRLRAAGVPSEAFDTGGYDEPAQPQADALTELSLMDSPDVRALLAGVAALVPLAEKIDQARGRWYPDAPETDTKGTDLAEQLHLIACRLSLEMFGPSTGRD